MILSGRSLFMTPACTTPVNSSWRSRRTPSSVPPWLLWAITKIFRQQGPFAVTLLTSVWRMSSIKRYQGHSLR